MPRHRTIALRTPSRPLAQRLRLMPLMLAALCSSTALLAQPTAVAPAAPTPASSSPAAASPVAAVPGGLDTRIESLKSSVIQLNRDLLVLEEELLFPANTQMAVFVSMDVGKLFSLESVQLRVGDQVVANHLYTPLEVQALHRGGVQRLYLGNLKTGTHELVAYFTGQGPHTRDYRRATTVKVDKAAGPRYVELRIEDSTGKLQPEFKVKVWE